MSKARSRSPKNWAAKRRRSRQIEGRRAAAASLAPYRPPNAEMTNCGAVNCGVGMVIGPGYHVRSRGFRAVGNGTAIVNRGTFDGPDTVIE
jgi:hypothetical protein